LNIGGNVRSIPPTSCLPKLEKSFRAFAVRCWFAAVGRTPICDRGIHRPSCPVVNRADITDGEIRAVTSLAG
jgi:hypothetical protein